MKKKNCALSLVFKVRLFGTWTMDGFQREIESWDGMYWRPGTLALHSLFSMAEGGIFAEDIVKNAQGNVGVVLEDAEETTDESDSDEEALKKGQIVVCWYPSGNEETISISKVVVVLYLHLRNVYRHFDFDPRNLNCLIFFFHFNFSFFSLKTEIYLMYSIVAIKRVNFSFARLKKTTLILYMYKHVFKRGRSTISANFFKISFCDFHFHFL